MYRFFYHKRGETAKDAKPGYCRTPAETDHATRTDRRNSHWLSHDLDKFAGSMMESVMIHNSGDFPQYVTVVDENLREVAEYRIDRVVEFGWDDLYHEVHSMDELRRGNGPLAPEFSKAELEIYTALPRLLNAERKMII